MLWVLLAIFAVMLVVWMRQGGRVGRTGANPTGTARTKACKWSATGEGQGRLKQYRCATCGVTAYSGTGKPPAQCKKNLGGGAL